MFALNDSTRWNFKFFSKRAAVAMLASAALLSACGGGGDAGGSDSIPDSITVTSMDGPSGGSVGQTTTMNVKVTTTGNIAANEISYNWEQTAGTAVLSKSQNNGDYESTLSFIPGVAGDVTFKVTVSARGKTGSQSKSVPIN
ncbi:hypothetical protein GCM10027046_04820 [Uliginosibacterium flavum]